MSDNQFSDLPSSFIPPESGQPYQSLFGGPSSQDVDLQPYPESQQNAGVERGHDHDDFDAIMRDISLMDDHQSDATYHASDEDESEPGGAKSHTSASPKKRKKPVAIKEYSISPPLSPRYRPNKFRGPDSTWQKLTVEERQNAQALETIRARDLTVHLYNSYALRVRARERGQQTTKRNKKLSEAETFVPSSRWTAWPMSADEVPRADERLRREEDDAWTLRMPLDPRPSADLEESVIAVMLKNAKDRFGAREWDSKRAISQPKKRHTSYAYNDDESVGYDANWGSDQEFMDDAELHPVVQADDDKSRQQLRPISRDILTQFDQLLMGLHHAQTGGAGDDSSGSELHNDTESVASSASPRKRNCPGEAAGSQSRGRKQRRNTDKAHSGKQNTSRTRGRILGRRNDRSASRIREGLRDWSEVVGIASMTGWPSAAVMRAAKRCSTLFGEDMAFQTFNEGTVEKVKEDEIEDVRYVEPEPEPEPESSPPDTRQSQPTSRRSRSRSRSRATSTKRESPANVAPETNGEPPKGKGQHRKMDIVCPVKKCSRHENGFTRTWNLNLHMKRMHPGYRPKKSRRMKVNDEDTADR